MKADTKSQNYTKKEYQQMYQIKSRLGSGTYGDVFWGRDKSGKDVALKELKSSSFSKIAEQQAKLMKQSDHPNILKCFEYFRVQNRTVIVTQLCQKGDLSKYAINRQFSQPQRIKLLYQLTSAIHYLHQKSIAHRDIKPQNILLTKDLVSKLCDFGFGKTISEDDINNTTKVGTPAYTDPLVIQGKYSLKCDIFSIGCLIGFLYDTQFPRGGFFKGCQTRNELYKAHKDYFGNTTKYLQNRLPRAPEYVYKLIQNTVTKDQSRRMNTLALLRQIESIHQLNMNNPNYAAQVNKLPSLPLGLQGIKRFQDQSVIQMDVQEPQQQIRIYQDSQIAFENLGDTNKTFSKKQSRLEENFNRQSFKKPQVPTSKYDNPLAYSEFDRPQVMISKPKQDSEQHFSTKQSFHSNKLSNERNQNQDEHAVYSKMLSLIIERGQRKENLQNEKTIVEYLKGIKPKMQQIHKIAKEKLKLEHLFENWKIPFIFFFMVSSYGMVIISIKRWLKDPKQHICDVQQLSKLDKDKVQQSSRDRIIKYIDSEITKISKPITQWAHQLNQNIQVEMFQNNENITENGKNFIKTVNDNAGLPTQKKYYSVKSILNEYSFLLRNSNKFNKGENKDRVKQLYNFFSTYMNAF